MINQVGISITNDDFDDFPLIIITQIKYKYPLIKFRK